MIKMDLFVFGRLLFQMVTGINPFSSATKRDQKFVWTIKGDWKCFLRTIKTIPKRKKIIIPSSELKMLLEGSLNPKPDLRLSIQQVRESEWFVNTKSSSLKGFLSN